MRRFLAFSAIGLIATILSLPASAQQVPPIVPDPCFVLGGGGITNPLQALQGTWGFKLEGFSLATPGVGFVGAIGNFTFNTGQTSRSPVLQGLVTGRMSAANLNGTVGPLNAAINGNFQVEPNCSGGNISFGNGALPPGFRTVQFVFVNNFTQMYLLSADNNGVMLIGEAKKMF